jgi:hypothetical protein
LYRNISLHRLEQRWHRRGDPAQLGATLHRDADEALLVCRKRARPALAAFEAIAKRRDLTLNRDKTRETRLTEGFDCLGVECVKRQSPTRGKNTIDLLPAQAAQQKIRNKLKDLTSRRAPSSPQACVAKVKPVMTGWVNDFRPTNASQAFRGRPRVVNSRFRRYLTQSSQGRGGGWKRSPHRKLYAMGLADLGSGQLEYVAKPVPGLR